MPCCRSTSSRKISEKKPRGSRWRTGLISFTSAISVEMTCMREGFRKPAPVRWWATLIIYRRARRDQTTSRTRAPRSMALLRRRCPVCQSPAMRSPNYYAAPGFERAGLRRREPDWILARVLDPQSVFIPVWRNQNLVIEVEGGEPRAAVLTVDAVGPLFGSLKDGDVAERLSRGEFVFLGVIEERAHFALDVSGHEAALDMLRSPALAAAGIDPGGIAQIGVRFADLRQLAGRLDRHEGALLAFARAMMFWHSRHRFCGLCGSPTRSE